MPPTKAQHISAGRTEDGESAKSDEIRQGVATGDPDRDASIDETLLLLNRVVHAAVTNIVVTDPHLPDNPIIYHNPAFERVSGYSASEIDGRNCRFLQGPDTDPDTVAEIREAIAEGRSGHFTILNYRRDGTPFWNDLNISPVRDADGRVTHFVGVQNDVTRRAEAERERDVLLARQQRIAETLQRALLLTPRDMALRGWEVSTQYEPAWDESLFGGDFFDVFAVGEDCIAFVVGDVAGKGLQAAQHTAEVKYALRVLLREYGETSAALRKLNLFLLDAQRLDDRDAAALVCVAVALVDNRTGTASIVTAGMENPLVIRHADSTAEPIPSTGFLLGMDESASYEPITVDLRPGDILAMVTDGATEARNPALRSDFFGYERLVETARAASTSIPTLDAIGAHIVSEVRNFAGGKPQDDVCLLLARYAGLPETPPAANGLFPADGGAGERLRQESARREQAEESLRLALEAGRLGLWRVDLATGEMECSDQCRANFGLAPGAPISYADLLAMIHSDDLPVMQKALETALTDRTDYRVEYRIHAEDGTERWIAAHGRGIYPDAEGSTTEVMGMTQDITERREGALRQRRFLKEMLFGLTEGRLRLCDSEADLPARLPEGGDLVVHLTPETLRSLRREVMRVAASLEFPEGRDYDLEAAVGEASMNAVRHASSGEARVYHDPEAGVVQVWIRDRGEGIAEHLIHRAIERGWTTGGFGQGFYLMWRTCDRLFLLTGSDGTTVVLEQGRQVAQPAWILEATL